MIIFSGCIYTKTEDSVFCAVWLAPQSVNIQCYSLIHFQFLLASDVKLVSVNKSKVAYRFSAIKQRNIKQAVPEINEEEIRFGNFNRYQ